MLAIVGTVPDKEFPLVCGEVYSEDGIIVVNGHRISVNRGTPALLASALKVCEVLHQPSPFTYLIGDTGIGKGSRVLYEYLSNTLQENYFQTLVFHYLQPDVDWHNRILFAILEMKEKPVLIADAGFMYAAKMSGQAKEYDLFTPDVGEMAFLADEDAPHPFYTRGFILHEDNRIPDLITRAYEHGNAARYLLVKGNVDHIASNEGIHATIDNPKDESMEAIGGTGDTLTGIVSALISYGMATLEASILAARINRLAGHYADPTPATQVMNIIESIPMAMEDIMKSGERP